MRENIVLICPTPQAPIRAADWHDGQFAHGVYAGVSVESQHQLAFNCLWHRAFGGMVS
jgi:hypothetical protein